jgi:hypothetical protein
MKKVGQKHKRLPVSFTINDCLETEDSRFLAITIDVLHTGLNFNGSIFTKEVVDANAESIKNTPVLGYIALNPDGEMDFQGHEYKTVVDEDGEKQYVYAGSAYGVIPESCNCRWIEKVCSDGVCRDFFQVDALLWTKFNDAVTIFERDGSKPQSMELELSSITGEENDDGTFTFTGFNFDGCCLLSSTDESIQPAMIDSLAVAQYTAQSISQEIKNKLQEYSISVAEKLKDDKGGIDMSKPNSDFTLNLMEQLDEIYALLSEKTYRDNWGYECSQYCFVDVQDDEIIVMDRADHYRMYGMKFTVDGDKITIDFESASRKKTKYENLEDGSNDNESFVFEKAVSDVADYMNEQINTLTADKGTAEANYEAVKKDYDEMKPKYDAYVVAEQAREEAAVEAAKDAEFQKYDQHLNDVAKYTTLKSERDKYSLDDIQAQCAIMFAEKNLNSNFSRKGAAPMVAPVVEPTSSVEVNSRYGVLPMKK